MREQRRGGKVLTPTLGRTVVTDMGDIVAIRETTDGSWVSIGRAERRALRAGRRTRTSRPVRDVDDGFGNLIRVRFCAQCRSWLPLRVPYFAIRSRDPLTRRVLTWDNWCVACRRPKLAEYDARLTPEQRTARNRQRDARIRADPVRRAQWQKTKRESYDRRAKVPEVAARRRESRRARYAAMKQDAERYAAYLDARRMYYRIRQERLGREVTKRQPARNPYRESTGRVAQAESHPVLPFALWVQAVLEADHREFDEVAASMGVANRRLYGYRHRQTQVVALASADRAIWGYGKPVLIPAELVEEERARLEALWRSSPGNGERILGYLKDVERIAPLAGAVIDRVEDLWEELGDEPPGA